MTAASDLRAWFLGRADLTDINGCWEWKSTHDRDGYARATYYMDGRIYSEAGHRLAYEVLVGPIPDGLVIDHLCRNRGCVNPGHMEPVTIAENIRRGIRGIGSRARTHCVHGHEFTEENTYLWEVGGRLKRSCRPCRLRQGKARRSRGTSTGSPTALDVPRGIRSVHTELPLGAVEPPTSRSTQPERTPHVAGAERRASHVSARWR